MSEQEKKNRSIAEAIRAIHKQFGSGSIMRLDGSEVQQVEVIPTGSVALDVALGCGGLPRGRIIEIYGPESSGKTTLTLHAIAEAQRAGGVCAFIDAEHALDTDYARRLGVELEDLLVSPARLRRAGARDRRHARAHRRDRSDRRRLGRRAHAAGRDRGRDGRRAHGPAGAPDEPGAAQADRADLADAHDRHLHQPAAPEDRRRLRQPRDHDRRQRAQVLLLGAARHPPQEGDQARRGDDRQRGARSRS